MPEHEKITVAAGANGQRQTASVPEGTHAVTGTNNIVGAGNSNAHDPIKVTAGAGAPTTERVLTSEPRPTWLPERFKTTQDLLKSQEEGQATITRLSQELAELKKAGTPAATPASAQPTPNVTAGDGQTPANASLQPDAKAKISMAALSQEWAANGGKITPESLKKLEAVGFTQEDVGQFIAGQQALADRVFTDLYKITGGEDTYKRVMEFYRGTNAGLEFNKALATGNSTGAQMMLRGMIGDFQREVGRNPRMFITGTEASRAATEQPFQSMAEMQAAMKDPRYKNDPMYQRSVARRAAELTKARRGR